MKRFTTFVAPTLAVVALLGTGSMALAQNATLSLNGVSPITMDKRSGPQNFTLALSGSVDLAGGKLSNYFANLVFNPQIFSVVSTVVFEPAGGFPTGEGQAQRTGGSGATAYSFFSDFRNRTVTTPIDFNAGTTLINYQVSLKPDAALGATKLGLSDVTATATQGGALPTSPSTIHSYISVKPATGSITRTGQTYLNAVRTVTVVPGPSSLAVFAMGGLAPAMALIRRRRVSK